jgi:alpha-tubulin suppressor-like RCC1 family protein
LRIVLGAVVIALVGASCGVKIGGKSPEPVEGIACSQSEECPYPTRSCLLAMCLEGRCVFVPAPEGRLSNDDQKNGDCRELYCDSDGNVVPMAANFDVPADDGNACTEEVCLGVKAKHKPKKPGEACGKGVCNTKGQCGACTPNAKRCDGQAIVRCDGRGQWVAPKPCDGKAPICSEGVCLGIVEMALGDVHGCARLSDGSVRCWGSPEGGRLGDGGVAAAAAPLAPEASPSAFGARHACRIDGDGSVWCWGAGEFGQLGHGKLTSSDEPVRAIVSGAVEIAVGGDHSCARTDSDVFCWGRNDHGQVGGGAAPVSRTPEALALSLQTRLAPRPIAEVNDAARLWLDGSHTCVTRKSGQISCWGNESYALPDDSEGAAERKRFSVSKPTKVAVSGAVEIGCGQDHSCARLGDGSVSCWGAGNLGQHGGGGRNDSNKPLSVASINDAIALRVGGDFACVVHRDATVGCWGHNARGQLGRGTSSEFEAPGRVQGVSGVQTLDVAQDFACVMAGERLLCWGLLPGGSSVATPRPLGW